VAFCPDGRLVASGTNRIRLWDVATGRQAHTFGGHHAKVTSLAFAPDGSRLASGLRDSTVLLWEVPRRVGMDVAAARPAELAALWSDLAGGNAHKAHRAGWRLVAAAQDAVPFLAKRVRAAPPLDGKRWSKLIADLDSDEFAVRTAAYRELERLTEGLQPDLLRKALAARPTLEVRLRLQRLLARSRALGAGETLAGVRALAVLERAATPAARAVLRRLAGGEPQARLTQEAKEALARLGRVVGKPSPE
jgi:hypothetical protein